MLSDDINFLSDDLQRNCVPEDPVEYLVITSQALANSFSNLQQWKRNKAINLQIITTDSIYNTYNGNDNQEKIKRCIYDYYMNYGTKYVMLGGDDTIVPIKTLYSFDEEVPVDLYYSCFNGDFNWDTDNIDFTSSVYLARLPIRTNIDVTNYTSKLMNYEKGLIKNNYNMLFTGSKLYRYMNDGKSDSNYLNDKLYNYYIKPYHQNRFDSKLQYLSYLSHGPKFEFGLHDTSCDLPQGTSYFLSGENLYKEINRGYNLIHQISHGDINGWEHNDSLIYTSNDAQQQENGAGSVILSGACFTNRFNDDLDPCLSEALIRNPNGGAVAYWGSSDLGYGYPSSGSLYNYSEHYDSDNNYGLAYSDLYDGYFYKNLLEGYPSDAPYCFGAVAAKTKEDLLEECTYSNPYKWLQLSLNPIGDPEMQIYTDKPMTISSSGLMGNSLTPLATVSPSGLYVETHQDGCTISVLCNDNKKYKAVNVSSAFFPGSFNNFKVVIQKKNCIPLNPVVFNYVGSGSLDNLDLQITSLRENVMDIYWTDKSAQRILSVAVCSVKLS